MQLKFSIVINTLNRAHTLPAALESLQWLRYPNFEVIVVNGPSTDNTEAVVQPYLDRVKYGRCPEANLSMSRNIGIAMAAGDVVCFMDDDAVPEPDWLNQLATGYTEHAVAGVGGFIRDHTGYTFQCKVVACDRYGNGESFDSLEEARLDAGSKPFRFTGLTGTNSSFRREALLAIGGFDEEFVYFLDETDVIVRLIDAGYRVELVPNAEIHHKYASSDLRTADRVPKSVYFSARSKAYFCVRHGAPATSLDAVMRHLDQYQKGLRRDYRWYLENGKIDALHHNRLNDDIVRGLRDGVSDAFAKVQPTLLTAQSLRKHSARFQPFPIRLAAGQRLKICFLTQDYPPRHCGGIGRWTFELATRLAAQGHEISVVTRGHDHPTVDFEQGVWVHRIIPTWQPKRVTPPLPDIPQIIKDYAYTAYDEVMRIRVRRGLDIVSSPIWDLEGAACIADGSFPTVLSLHSTFKLVLPSKPEWHDNPEYKAGHVDKIISGERWALLTAHHILANSRAVVRDIEAAYDLVLPPERCQVVAHGIDRVEELHLEPGVPREPGGRIRLLFVGRFEKRKGIDLLLAALPTLMEKYPQLDALLVGDHAIPFESGAPIKDRFLAAHAGKDWLDRVVFTGVVDDSTLHANYRDCDIFVAPSRYESFGLIFLEAMRFGKACVGTQVGGIQEVIDNGRTGLLCASEDMQALQAAIARLVESPDLRHSLGNAARESFELSFSSETMALHIAQKYREWSMPAPVSSMEAPL